jgi:hypothetical protein
MLLVTSSGCHAAPQGYVTAVWTQGSQIHSSVLDAVDPALQTVTVPASGVAGQPVAMSVVASDLWCGYSRTGSDRAARERSLAALAFRSFA